MSTDTTAGAGLGAAAGAVGTEPVASPIRGPRTRLFAWREVVLPWLVSRLISDALILVLALQRARPALYAGFAKWDGGWYTLIARNGYGGAPVHGHESPWPFFPFLPAVMRAGGALGVPEELVGVLVNHAAFLLALAGLYRLARRHVTDRGAVLAVWAVACFPGSFLFSMVYPSSIFLAASVWAFLLIEEGHDLGAGLVTIAAVMVRPNGFVVALALAFALRRTWRRILPVCLPSAVFFGAWCVYNLDRTGDALTFWRAKSGWPEVTIVDFANRFHKYAIPHLALAVAAVVAVVLVWRTLPRAWIVLTALYLVPPLFIGIVGLGRYATECFPPFVAAGELLRRFRQRTVLAMFALSLVVEGVCAYWVVYSKWLP